MNEEIFVNGCKIIEIPFLFYSLKCIDKDNVLVIGERSGEEGIIWSVLQKTNETNNIQLIDLSDVAENSIVQEVLNKRSNVKFKQTDFLDIPDEEKYDYIVCINVLEHFGMCWNTESPIIDWNKDLEAIKKMMSLFNKRIIITVPAGPPIFYGDCLENGLPFLRRYDKQRIELIHKIVKEHNCQIVNESFFYSETLNNDWKKIENGSEAFTDGFGQYQKHTPNCLWIFCIERNNE